MMGIYGVFSLTTNSAAVSYSNAFILEVQLKNKGWNSFKNLFLCDTNIQRKVLLPTSLDWGLHNGL